MSKNILVVEDDMLLSEALTQIFTEHGYAVHTSHNGRDALAQIEVQTPDFVLLDLMMPEMNGIEFMTELQKNPQHAKIPVTVLTNANDMDSVTAVMAQGGYHYFIKADTPLASITEHVIKTLEPAKAAASV